MSNYSAKYFKRYGRTPGMALFREAKLDFKSGSFYGKPEKAAEALAKKEGNYVLTWNWDEMSAKAHVHSFTAAKCMNADVLQTIHSKLRKAQDEGIPFKKFYDDIKPELEKAGWIDAGGKIQGRSAESRLKTIFQTNIRSSFMKGRYNEQKKAALLRPFWKYIQINRKSKRDEHEKLDGKIFRHDDPIWQKAYPPRGYNCACTVRTLSKREMERDKLKLSKGKDYDFKPDKNWDLKPDEDWMPDMKGYEPALRNSLGKDLKQRESIRKKMADRLKEKQSVWREKAVSTPPKAAAAPLTKRVGRVWSRIFLSGKELLPYEQYGYYVSLVENAEKFANLPAVMREAVIKAEEILGITP